MITVAACASSDDVDQYDDVQGQVLGSVAVSASSDDDQPHSLNSDSVRSDRIFSTFDKVRGGGIVAREPGRKKRLAFLKAAGRRKILQGHF